MTTAAAPRRAFLDEHFDDIGVRSTVDLRPEVQAVVERQGIAEQGNFQGRTH